VGIAELGGRLAVVLFGAAWLSPFQSGGLRATQASPIRRKPQMAIRSSVDQQIQKIVVGSSV
jgi:hypothetical protein